jgi:SRSO17 transposase
MTQARPAAATVAFVDDYCQLYKNVFPDVRSFEHFKQIQIGMLSEIKRKTLPAIAQATGESDAQALHRFVAYAPWRVEELRDRRLSKLKQALAGRAFTLCIDETGERKKGKTTDDVASQYIGNIGKLANGIEAAQCLWSAGSDHLPLAVQSLQAAHATLARRYLQNETGVGHRDH